MEAYARQLSAFPLVDSTHLFVGTTNFGTRKPNFVIIHHTAQNSCEQTLRTFTIEKTKVSSHYVICRDGTIYYMLNDLLRGQHAGVSKWGSLTDLNSVSIGIELDNNGNEPFAEEQTKSLLALLTRLKNKYSIPQGNFLGHLDIAPGRKVDPSRYFPWERLAKEGFGFWYDTTAVKVHPKFDALTALRMIGYNTAKPEAALLSYKIHYVPHDSTKSFNAKDEKILSSLVEKYL